MKRNWGIALMSVVAVICTLLTAASPRASACDVSVFKKTYIRQSQKPQVFINTFKASKPTGSFALTVKNGKNGSFRVSAALIWINGEEIIGVSDFNKQVALLTRPVLLKAANEIKVELRGKPGDFISVDIAGIDRNTPPVANAGPNQTVHTSTTVHLDGSGSSDVDHDSLTYSWAILSKPAGSAATLCHTSIVNPTFKADKPGTYVVRLIVNDGIVNSAPVTTTITVLSVVINQPPIVAAGPSQTIPLHATATLNGSATDDGLPTGSTLSVAWSKASGSGTVTFSNPNTLATTATFSAADTYVLRLTACDGALSSTSNVTITVNPGNQAPVVNAGSAQTITLPATAALNGTATDDGLPTGSTLNFTWSKASGMGTVTFSNPNALSTTATFSVSGTYVVRLTASDGALSSTSNVTITVNPGNQAPVVNAGAAQTITLPATAALNGTATDDGLPTGSTLNVAWSKASGTGTVTFSNPNALATTAAFSAADTYVLRLTASDGALSATSNVTITVNPGNQAPVVNAGSAQTVTLPATAALNGMATDDGLPAAGGTLGITWSKASGPDTVTFSNPNALSTTATFSSAGIYVLRLTANDGALSSTSDVTITVNAANQAPVVNAGSAQTITLPATATLNGTATDDGLPTGSTLNFTWSKASGTGTVTFSNPNALSTTATFSAADTYVLRVTATDGALSGTSNVAITVNSGNQAPVVNAGSAQSITLPATAALNGSATDDGLPTGSTFSVAWSKASGTGTVTFSNPDALATTATFSATGIYDLRLTASDGVLSSTSDITIVVDSGNRAPAVNAGSEQTITLPATAALIGTATDDGLPTGSTLSVTWSKFSGPGTVSFSNPNALATTATFSMAGAYVLRLSANDGALSSTSDVTITTHPANQAPIVNAGSAQTITLPATAALNGTATDDGLPAGSALSVAWSKFSGPGTVTFSNPNALATTSTFSIAGTYILRLTANDGALSLTSDVIITVNAANQAPMVNAGSAQTITLPATAALNGTATDDGLPAGSTLGAAWSKFSGPGEVTFSNPNALSTTATFSTAGTYVLRLTASDGALSPTSDVTITVNLDNQVPMVNAGSAQPITLPATATLNGTATDDGLPAGSTLSVTWSKFSGPGTVTFSDATAVATPVGFSMAGSYVLRLTASDSQLTSSSDVTITVNPVSAQPPVAVDDLYSTEIAKPLAITKPGVLGNDADPNRDPLTAVLVKGPTHGDLSFNADGSFGYTPSAPTPGAPLNPVLKWAWNSSAVLPDSLNVMSTPAVIDLDGDGIPEIIFGSSDNRTGAWDSPGVLRALRGDTGAELFTVTDPSLAINFISSVAVGDIDGDGHPEIIACGADDQSLIAFNHDGSFKWRSPTLENVIYGGAPALADLDGDGKAEIVIGRQVLNSDGSLRWTGTGSNGSKGTGSLSIVADIDLDGKPEVVVGNTAYRADGTKYWQNGGIPAGGFNAIGNFDNDAYPEIVLVGAGWVYLLKHDGTKIWELGNISNFGSGGPPTVADFDGDGKLEIGIAGHAIYLVLDASGNIKWSAPILDTSSDVTGSSVFDFDGDGSPEVVNRDETKLRVFRGTDGAVLFETPMSSCTGHEYVLVADVDADHSADILAVANNNCGKGPQRGIFVFSGNNWVPTRKIWNQHSYHVTNVNEDGTIPRFEDKNWLLPGLNNYRLNTYSPRDLATVDTFTYKANDGQFDSNTATVSIKLIPGNKPPVVNPGLTQTITMPASASLNGAVTDDGLPMSAGLAVNWSEVSGPGTVTFGDSHAAVTTASFSVVGVYILRLTASDSQLSSSADVTVSAGTPILTVINPNNGRQAQANLNVAITGGFTHFSSQSVASFSGTGITVNSTAMGDDNHVTANITIAADAALGARDVTVTTGAEVASLAGGFAVGAGTPILTVISPNNGRQGQTSLNVAFTGKFTNFLNGTSAASFGGTDITLNSTTVADSTHATANITIANNAVLGARSVTITTNSEVVSLANGFAVSAGTPALTLISPNSRQQGQSNLIVAITGQFTHFNGQSAVGFSGTGITINSTTVLSATNATVNITIADDAPIGARSVTVTTNTEVVSLANSFTVTAATPILTLIGPNGGQQGQSNLIVAITGRFTHFVNGTSAASFSGTDITINSFTVGNATHATADITIAGNAALGARTVTVTTNAEVVPLASSFTVIAIPTPAISQISPNAGQQGQANLNVVITGQFTNFIDGTSIASFSGTDITVNSIAVGDATHATANITIAANAVLGARNVTVTTNAQVVSLANGFTVTAGTRILTLVNPGNGQQGEDNLDVAITGQFTHFVNGQSTIGFSGTGITVNSTMVGDATHVIANVSIAGNAALGARNVTVTTNAEVVSLANSFAVTAGTPILTLINPNSGKQGQAGLNVAITGQYTNFLSGTSIVRFSGSGITVNNITVGSATHATANISIAGDASPGVRSVTVTTGTEVASLAGGFTVTGPPTLTLISPNTGQQGQASLDVAITGQYTNFLNHQSAVSFGGTGITVNSITVVDATYATANITIEGNAALGARNVTVTTTAEVASLANSFTVTVAPMQLKLGQNVITAGNDVSFVLSFFDSAGHPVPPSKSPVCGLTAMLTGLNQGTMPVVGAGAVSTSSNTRGAFRLTCSIDSLSRSQDFVVIEPDGASPSQPGLYSTLSKSLADIGSGLGKIADALQQPNPQLTSIQALHAALLASRDAVDLIETRNSSAFSPEGGFPPTTGELSAQGIYPTSHDVAFSNLVDSITAKIISITTFINSLDPSNMTDAEGIQLNQFNADLAALRSQFQALNPSIYGVVAASSRMNLLLAVYLPNYLYATVNKADQALTSNGFLVHMLDPDEFYLRPGGQRGPLPALDTPSAFYGKARPAFFGMIELMISQSVSVQLIEQLYGPAIKALINSAMLLAADGLLKSYLKAANLDGIITGAESLTLNAFNLPDSFIEGEGFNPLPLRNEVWLVGPDAVGAIEKVGDLFRLLPKPPAWKDFKGAYEFFKQVRELIKSTIEARDHGIEMFERANQPPDWVSQGYGIFGSESAIDLIYDMGFDSVYTDEEAPDLPQPVLIIVHNLDGGFAMGIYSFLKDLTVRQ